MTTTRVHALARELGVSHQELLALIREMPQHIPAETAMSHLTEEDVAAIRHVLEVGLPTPAPSPAPEPRSALDLRPRAATASTKTGPRGVAASSAPPWTPSAPTREERLARFRAFMQEYRGFAAAWRDRAPPEPARTLHRWEGGARWIERAALATPARLALARRDDAMARFYARRGAQVEQFLFGALPIRCDPATRDDLRRGAAHVMAALRLAIPRLYGSMQIDWEYFARFTQPYLQREEGSVRSNLTREQVRRAWSMREEVLVAFRERVFEYDESDLEMFEKWLNDPLRIDVDWAFEEQVDDLARGVCFAHELLRAEELTLEPLLEHVFAGGAHATCCVLLDDNENVKHQFSIWVGEGGAALTLDYYEL